MRFTVDLQAERKRSPALAESARQPLVDRLRPNRRPSTECNDGFSRSRSLKGHRLRKRRMLRGAGPLPRCDLLLLLGVLPSACFFTASLCCVARSPLHFLFPFRQADEKGWPGGGRRQTESGGSLHPPILFALPANRHGKPIRVRGFIPATDESLPSACGLLVDDSSKAVSVVLGLRSNPATLLVCPVNWNNRFVIGLGRSVG